MTPSKNHFVDVSKHGSVTVREYEDAADHLALLISVGEDVSIKMSAEQGKELHSALLRNYECVQA